MSKQLPNNSWWGPPKKYTTRLEERRITWLELFYDLVYAIIISKATHFLATHLNRAGIENYTYLFIMIFWGWYNGSQYYDLHGTPGARTRFMTLWQMVAVAALAVALGSPPETLISRSTIALAVLQFYITYIWWSVGIYDKDHRKLNVPFTVCYTLALCFIIATLVVDQPLRSFLFAGTLILNFLPQFLLLRRFEKGSSISILSGSMAERLGLLTIIVFGEAILGVINGINPLSELTANIWFCFALGIMIVFVLWWMFFTLIADRKIKTGFWPGNIMSLAYVPTLASLGMIGTAFTGLMSPPVSENLHLIHISRLAYAASIALFLFSSGVINAFVIYPDDYAGLKKAILPILAAGGIVIVLVTFLFQQLSTLPYLISVLLILLLLIILISLNYYRSKNNAL